MISEDSSIKEDDYIVRVKAQVMTRDESTGGWVPLGRGGMSVVGLRRLVTATGDDISAEYRLQGQRIADQSMVLNCVLKKDLQYTKANPTFHHWWTGDKRFGLTFQSSADARVLERSVCKAMESILTPPSCNALDAQVTDDDVFMSLNLPMGKDDSWSQSISTASTATSSPSVPLSPADFDGQSTERFEHLCHITRPARSPLLVQSPGSSSVDDEEVQFARDTFQLASTSLTQNSSRTIVNIEMVDYSYVKLAKTCTPKHDYTYPSMDSMMKSGSASVSSPQVTDLPRYSSTGRLCHAITFSPPAAILLPVKMPRSSKGRKEVFRHSPSSTCHLMTSSTGVRSRCVYCHEMFTRNENRRGACPDAPDPAAQLIDRVSCLCCARAVMYHCMSPPADECHLADDEPCSCGMNGGGTDCCRRWTLLAVLALFVPCLWCYLPLSACHRCVRWCGCCGGRHKAT
jgi:sprouty-related EVH1 domain-containing protein